jgi:hypothetical protein
MKKAIKTTAMDYNKSIMEGELQNSYLDIGLKRLQETLQSNRRWVKHFCKIDDEFHDEVSQSICFIIEKMELNQKISSILKQTQINKAKKDLSDQ